MNTVSLCMICKNEISNIAILLDQVCPVLEQVILVDTGSTDGTLDIIKEKQSKYKNLELHHFEWVKDFSKARNYSFSFATQDWILFLDSDDQVDKDELKKFKDNFLENPDTDCWILDYIYSSFPDGTPQLVLGRERFVRRSLSPKFVGAIHETIDISGFRQKNYYDLKVIHNRNGKVIDYNRNIDILSSEYEKNPNDPRTAYYYGKELFDRVDSKGIDILKHYLTLDGKWWDDCVNAQFRLACDDLVNNRLNEAYERASQIYILDNSRERAEYYWILGSIEKLTGNYASAIRFYKLCLDLNPASPRVVNREYYTWNPLQRISECYLLLGDIDKSMEYYDKAYDLIGEMIVLRDCIISYFEPKNGLIILDYLKLREDSYHMSYHPINIKKEFVDGIISNEYSDKNAAILKEKGFYWHINSDEKMSLCQTISLAKYKNTKIYNSIKKLKYTKTYIIPNGNDSFGPYRLRLKNLRNSLIKNGYKVLTNSEDKNCTYISQVLSDKKYKTNVLDVCEWLPNCDYNSYGIQYADLIVCSSPLLAKNMKEKFTDKKITCVEDHVDMTDQEWL